MLLDNLIDFKVYLASASQRRHQLLSEMGIQFKYLPIQVEENYPNYLTPIEVCEYLSKLKLAAINRALYPKNSLFIACDTIVVLEGKIMGKPVDIDDAITTLQLLSSKEHDVISGLSVANSEEIKTTHQLTTVKFKELTHQEIEYYVNHYHPIDKSGSYGIQEWIGLIGIEEIKGSFYNIMGMPTELLWKLLNYFSSPLDNYKKIM
ncbi:MAG: Maf family protein [Bacteroidales bacterium]|jgi:septum formation protein|nr:Maf family protein [Bacteroidales bacterium]